jgi:hypothetical protein
MGGGKKASAKKASAIVLVLGLVIEFKEAAKSDRETAQLVSTNLTLGIKLEDLRSTNLVLRAKVLELEVKVQPRTITHNQHASLAEKLNRGIKGPVAVQHDWTDAEATRFGEQILSVLTDAGFEKREANAQVLALNEFGVFMFVSNVTNPPSHAIAIQKAFLESGIFLDGKNAIQGGRVQRSSVATIQTSFSFGFRRSPEHAQFHLKTSKLQHCPRSIS